MEEKMRNANDKKWCQMIKLRQEEVDRLNNSQLEDGSADFMTDRNNQSIKHDDNASFKDQDYANLKEKDDFSVKDSHSTKKKIDGGKQEQSVDETKSKKEGEGMVDNTVTHITDVDPTGKW